MAPVRPSVRMPELVLGVLLVAGCALAAVLWQQSSGATRPALVLAHDVRRGDVLELQDFTSAEVRATGAHLLPYTDAERLVGRVVAANLSAFTPITDDLAVETIPLGADESLVGRRLELGQFPEGLQSGDAVTVRMKVRAQAPVDDFVFGISLFNADGVCCYGTNTFIEEMTPQRLAGDAEISFDMAALDLVEGTYKLDVAVHKRDGYPYDYHRLLYTFRVKSRVHDVGIYRPAHRWSFSGGVSFAAIGSWSCS